MDVDIAVDQEHIAAADGVGCQGAVAQVGCEAFILDPHEIGGDRIVDDQDAVEINGSIIKSMEHAAACIATDDELSESQIRIVLRREDRTAGGLAIRVFRAVSLDRIAQVIGSAATRNGCVSQWMSLLRYALAPK
ncbi:MAG: hypothetical protein IPH43_14980 [Xanthomonadales bacterium]|nr:hypothetical protein [Xanthomonadales bacterium]